MGFALVTLLLAQPLSGAPIGLGYLTLDKAYSSLGGTVQAFTVYNIAGQDPDCLAFSNLSCDPLDFTGAQLDVTFLDNLSVLQTVSLTLADPIAAGFAVTPLEWFFDTSVTIQSARFLAALSASSFNTADGVFESTGIAQSENVDFSGTDLVFGLINTDAPAGETVVPEPAQMVPLCFMLGGLLYFIHKRR